VHPCEFIRFEAIDGVGPTAMIFCDRDDKQSDGWTEKCGDPGIDTVGFACRHRDGTGQDRKTCGCAEDFWLCAHHLDLFWAWVEK
jgi:hypothetical protein